MMKCLLIMMTVFVWAAPTSAATDERKLTAMFDEVCQELDISKPLVMAIARVESGIYPWVLNIQGRSYRFANKAEALARAQVAWAAGQSFDVGIMQVNRWWLSRYSISLEAALDPLANIYLGGWILKQEFRRHKDLRKAVGAYHSPNPQRARRYADQVLKALEQAPAVEPQSVKKIAAPAASSHQNATPSTAPRTMKAAGATPMKVRSK